MGLERCTDFSDEDVGSVCLGVRFQFLCQPRPAVLKLDQASEATRGFAKTQIAGLHPEFWFSGFEIRPPNQHL